MNSHHRIKAALRKQLKRVARRCEMKTKEKKHEQQTNQKQKSKSTANTSTLIIQFDRRTIAVRLAIHRHICERVHCDENSNGKGKDALSMRRRKKLTALV